MAAVHEKPLRAILSVPKPEDRSRQEKEADSFNVQETLMRHNVTTSFLRSCMVYLTPADFDAIIEERLIDRRCGYPCCPNILHHDEILKEKLSRLPSAFRKPNAPVEKTVDYDPIWLQNPRPRFQISVKDKKIYEVSEMLRYCSQECLVQSRVCKAQLDDEPIYIRRLPPFQCPPEDSPAFIPSRSSNAEQPNQSKAQFVEVKKGESAPPKLEIAIVEKEVTKVADEFPPAGSEVQSSSFYSSSSSTSSGMSTLPPEAYDGVNLVNNKSNQPKDESSSSSEINKKQSKKVSFQLEEEEATPPVAPEVKIHQENPLANNVDNTDQSTPTKKPEDVYFQLINPLGFGCQHFVKTFKNSQLKNGEWYTHDEYQEEQDEDDSEDEQPVFEEINPEEDEEEELQRIRAEFGLLNRQEREDSGEDSEDDEDDDDLDGGFSRLDQQSLLPTMSTFGIIFSALDSWRTRRTLEYLRYVPSLEEQEQQQKQTNVTSEDSENGDWPPSTKEVKKKRRKGKGPGNQGGEDDDELFLEGESDSEEDENDDGWIPKEEREAQRHEERRERILRAVTRTVPQTQKRQLLISLVSDPVKFICYDLQGITEKEVRNEVCQLIQTFDMKQPIAGFSSAQLLVFTLVFIDALTRCNEKLKSILHGNDCAVKKMLLKKFHLRETEFSQFVAALGPHPGINY